MRHLLLTWAILLFAASRCPAEPPKRSLAPTEFTDTRFARRLEADIASIERSEPQGWHDLAGCAYHVDGEYGEVFSSACAYLLRRDPTLFLRRHLAGDPDAVFCAWAGYGWSGDYRPVLDTVYHYRLLDARTSHERREIREFIARTHDFNHVPPRPNHALQRTLASSRR